MAKIETREVVVGGVRSFVRTSGPSLAREAIVFVHGNPGSSEDWVDLLPRAGELIRAVAPDMPGFGKADRPKDFQYTVEGYARHLAGILEQLGVERAHLVLHDFGGPWGLTWAGAHPAAVKILTLVNIGLLRGYSWHKYAKIWRTPVLGELFQLTTTRGMFRMLLNHENPKPFPRAFVDRMFNDLNGGTKRAILKLYRATSDLDAMSRDLAPLYGSRFGPGETDRKGHRGVSYRSTGSSGRPGAQAPVGCARSLVNGASISSALAAICSRSSSLLKRSCRWTRRLTPRPAPAFATTSPLGEAIGPAALRSTARSRVFRSNLPTGLA